MKLLDAFFLIGGLASPIYASAMQIRSRLYENDIFKVERLSVPVISIGNLTMGGTGKTPTVRLICQIFKNKGFSPAIISRGYGGSAKEAINIVTDGTDILLEPEEAGDEPYMLASSLKGVPVLTGKKRILPCQYAIETFGCDLLLLDDGFQHMSVHRDLNLVLFNATTLAGRSKVFPGGELREPFSALERADAFILTGVTEKNSSNAKEFSEFLHKNWSQSPVFETVNTIDGIYDVEGNTAESVLSSHIFFAFSGIAHPKRFLMSLNETDIALKGHLQLKDHSTYSKDLMLKIIKEATDAGASALITTEKDIVKLKNYQLDIPLYYVLLNTSISDSFIRYLDSLTAFQLHQE